MLTEQNIRTNKETILTKNEQYGFYSQQLLNYLGDDFFLAPASTRLDLHNAFKGGLADHVLRVAKYAVQIAKLQPDNIRPRMESVIKVSFLAEIGKTFIYEENSSEWHKKNLGQMYEFVDGLVSLRVGERSAYYATKYGCDLELDEYQALLNYEKPEADLQAKWHTEPLGVILAMATKLAIIEEKRVNVNNE